MFIRTHRALTCNKKLNVSLQFSFTRPSLKFFFCGLEHLKDKPKQCTWVSCLFLFYNSYLSFNLILNLVEDKLQNSWDPSMFRRINTGFDIMASIDTKICYGRKQIFPRCRWTERSSDSFAALRSNWPRIKWYLYKWINLWINEVNFQKPGQQNHSSHPICWKC